MTKINKEYIYPTEDDIFAAQCLAAADELSFEERRSMPLEEYRKFVREHFIVLGKDELGPGFTYKGVCRGDVMLGTWYNGAFTYTFRDLNHIHTDRTRHFSEPDGNFVFIPIEFKP